KAPSFGIRRTPTRCVKCSAFCTKNAAPAAAPSRPKKLSRFRNEFFPQIPVWLSACAKRTASTGGSPQTQTRKEVMSNEDLQDALKQKYGIAAKQVTAGGVATCGGGAESSCCDPITKDLYDASQISALPKEAVAASLGC